MAYSFIGFQTAYLASHWNPIYWNTACLIINSGSLEDNSTEELVSIYEPEYQEMIEGTTYEDLPDRSGKIKKTASTDYAKVAKAIGNIISKGIKVSLVDINNSGYSFKPDAKNNEILFGMKGLNRVSDGVIEQIIAGRPYSGLKDFMRRCPLNKTVMVSLIKAGAFDKTDYEWASQINKEPRTAIMAYYLWEICDKKKKLTLLNLPGLIRYNLLPETTDKQIMARRIYEFNRYLKAECKNKNNLEWYFLNDRAINFLVSIDKIDMVKENEFLEVKVWDKFYKGWMDVFRNWIADNKEEILMNLNSKIFKETWEKYALGSIAAWEMESMCFYYHPHELSNVDKNKYGIVNFEDLNPVSEIESLFKRKGKEIPIYKLSKIMGTVIGKNDTRSSISLLTTYGVVNVKFTKEHYAMYNRQISDVLSDGTKKVMEKGWFSRGTMILVTGFRRDDTFNIKTYKSTNSHSIYKIEVKENGKDIELIHNRYGMED